MSGQSHKKRQQKAKNSNAKKHKGVSRDKLLNMPNEIEQAKNRKIYDHKIMSKNRF